MLCLKNDELLNFLERLRVDADSGKNLGITHVKSSVL